jgi:predicted NAD-dependent protein-ADP-ribosyltransferase YbiA (DUF1768 family)
MAKRPKAVNVSSNSEDWREAALSTFVLCIFSVDGVIAHSAEGMIQAIKLEETDSKRDMALRAHGYIAKTYGKFAKKKYIWWKGKQYPFNSPFHAALLERIIRARFIADGKAREALLATGNATITHNVGDTPKKVSMRRRAFCRLLMRIRTELRRTGTVHPG